MIEDEELRLVRQAQRDPQQFAPLYERYVDRVYAYCARRVDSPQEAEDLCSQVFVQAIKGLHTFTSGVFGAWLFAIARNVVAQHYRKTRKIISIDDFDLPDENSDDIDALVDADQDYDILNQIVDDLPEDKRRLLTLVLDSSLTSAQVGRMTNRSANAVRVEFHRLVKVLRGKYQQMMGGLNDDR